VTACKRVKAKLNIEQREYQMAEAKKPAARKPAARKTTTPRRKPAAKPAVDTTPPFPTEDDMQNGVTVATITPGQPPVKVVPISLAEKQALVEAYFVLKQAGVEPPADLAAKAEAFIAEAKSQVNVQQDVIAEQQEVAQKTQAEQIALANANGPRYVRNLRNMPLSIRLDRQTERRRIELKPRGAPGDMHELKEEDLNDPILRRNVALTMCEVIPAGEAYAIQDGQTHNMSTRVHTPLAVLRNENDKPYADGAFKTELEFNQQGVTVATVDPRVYQSHMTTREIDQSLQRTPQKPEVASAFIPTAGNPITIQAPSAQPIQGGIEAQIQRDISNRQHHEHNYHAGPGELQVTVNPVVKS
jgi:hypothetical protein